MASEPEAATDEASSPINFMPDTLQRVGVTAAVLTISLLLTYVPAPGLSPGAIERLATATGDSASIAVSRLSIVALGLSPILSALIAGEVLKLAAPSLYGLEDDPRRGHKFNRAVLILGLIFAAFQAYGITTALEAIQLPDGMAMIDEPGTLFRVSYMVTLVAGVALTYWLAEIITRHGIGSGFWVMLLAGELWAVPAALTNLAASHDTGQIATRQLLALTIAIAAAIISIVTLYRLRFTPAETSAPVDQLAPRDIMIPPLLGTVIASTLMLVVPLGQFLTGDESAMTYSFDPADPIRLILSATMILLIAYLRAATRPLSGAASTQAIRWALIAGAVTAAIIVALEILSAGTGIYLIPGIWIIVLAIVCLVFLSSQLSPNGPDHTRADAAPD